MGASNDDTDEVLPTRWPVAVRWGMPALTLAALAFLVWNCAFNPAIRFLTPGPGKYIVYPLPPLAVRTYNGFELTGTFRRSFALSEKPAVALLSWRCMTNGEVHVNGTLVANSISTSGNWKKTSRLNIAPLLRQGSNEISVVVINKLGPPALSLALKSEGFSLASDETWQTSVSGSVWRAAQAASVTPRPGRGSGLYPLETTGGALSRCWPWLGLFAAIALCGVALLEFCIGRAETSGSATVFTKRFLLLLAGTWFLLFIHNIPFMPPAAGFDAPNHLAYVGYIQDHNALPSAQDGWEMYQPPLYYMMSAALLDLGHCEIFQSSAMMLLRGLGVVIGVVTFALVFIGLRLLFPGDWKKPLAGLVLGAFLPAQIYLLHYPTNETLCAMFVTAALCVVLHLLRAQEPKWRWCGALGIVLGLGLLSKASAVVVVPVALGALAIKLMLGRARSPQLWLKAIVAPLLISLCISGWHYLKLWRAYGNPLIGGWSPKMVVPWWQAKGFQTPGYYFSFGDSLTDPFFSSLHSFWDAFYTTLWGDGLLGGAGDLWSRPPWNYEFMAIGFVLALIPAALILTGLARAVAKCFRAPQLRWLLLLALAWIFAFAILDVSLKVPSYSHTKAFFGLSALLPFCAFGALGFEFWVNRGRAMRFVLGLAVGLWLINVYASFWIRPNTLQSELSMAIGRYWYAKGDSSDTFSKILRQYPGDTEATIWLAVTESKKDPKQAVSRLEQAAKSGPPDAEIESELARDLVLCDRLDEAVVHAKRAVELAPEDKLSALTLCTLEVRRKNYDDAVEAGRHALSLDPTDPWTHYYLGGALMSLRQIGEAANHFRAVVDFKPTMAEAQYCLGLCLLNEPGNRDDGLNHLREAVRLNPTNAAWQTTLNDALARH